jgi:hypothetical protein
MDNPTDGTDGKLGRGFMSADKFEEIDIGDGDNPRLTFISVLTVKIHQPSHEFTFGVGISFIPYPLVLTPVV